VTHAPDNTWPLSLAGKFLVFEGPDGSGKTTQLRRFVEACKRAHVQMIEVREPGGTYIGETIRDLLLDKKTGELSMRCEMLLYMASRAQLVEEKIIPALKEGKLVIADRFVSSTLAYQGAAGGLPTEEIRDVARCAVRGIVPDMVIIFDVDEVTASKRMNPLLHAGNEKSTRDRAELDRIEARGLEFHRKVRQGYLEQAARDPSWHLVIDASQGPDEVWGPIEEWADASAWPAVIRCPCEPSRPASAT
jgi:dTMP kinase